MKSDRDKWFAYRWGMQEVRGRGVEDYYKALDLSTWRTGLALPEEVQIEALEGDKKFVWGRVQFEMPIKHLREYIKLAIG